MKIWPNLLTSVLLHAVLFGLLMNVTPGRHHRTEPCLTVSLVTLGGGEAAAGKPGNESDTAPRNPGQVGPGASGTIPEVPDPAAVPEIPKDHQNASNAKGPPGKAPSLPRDTAFRSGKPSANAKVRQPENRKSRTDEAPPHAGTCPVKPDGTTAKDGAAGPATSTPMEGGPWGGPKGNSGSGGSGYGSSGNGAGSHFHGDAVEARLGTPNGPKFLRKVLPKYPRAARELGMEGTVVLEVTIDARGLPIRVEPVKRAGYGFEDEAIKALRNSTFAPARAGGEQVVCRVLVPVRFQLNIPEDE